MAIMFPHRLPQASLAALLFALCLCLGSAGAGAGEMLYKHLGHGVPGSSGTVGTAFDCDVASGVCAEHTDGQTLVTWPDARVAGVCDVGTSTCDDYLKRYRLVQSTTGPIDAGNYGSATVIAHHILPNSGQLIGGTPDGTGSTFVQANRIANNAANPMGKIPDPASGSGLLRQLSYATGMAGYTALSSQDAWYAVIQTDTANANPVFLGSVGPISESVAPQQAILFTHHTTGVGVIPWAGSPSAPSGTNGYSMVFFAHGSQSGGGCAPVFPVCGEGDYYQWIGDTTEGWQDGTQKIFAIRKDGVGGTVYPSLVTAGGNLIYAPRDTIWNSTGNPGLSGFDGNETYWSGAGFTPDPVLVGPANRFYPITENTIKKQIVWIHNRYGVDLNKLYWIGPSMGAIGGFTAGAHMKSPLDPTLPLFAAIFVAHPVARWDIAVQWQGRWPASFWGGTVASPWPFSATVHDSLPTLGTNPAAVLKNDGSRYDATANAVAYFGSDLSHDIPMMGWMDAKDDTNLDSTAAGGDGGWKQMIDAVAALQAAHRPHTMNFYVGQHDTGAQGFGTINCDWNPGSALAYGCYKFSSFRLDQPVVAFDSSSIDDDMGTGVRGVTGIYDGDVVGVINAGFTWNVTSDLTRRVDFTFGNNYMSHGPTNVPTTVTTSTISGGTVTVADASQFLANGPALYYRIGNEIIGGTHSGATITVGARGLMGTTNGGAHTIGETVTQYPVQATGPNGGPYATMTANVTPWRLANFKPPNGTIVTCTATPAGGSTTTLTPTVVNSHFTLFNAPINAGVLTSASCVY